MSDEPIEPAEPVASPESLREFGPQPLAELMQRFNLRPHDLVAASPDQLTHKLVQRAIKGRWLTKNSRRIMLRAVNAATGSTWQLGDLFNYP